LAKNPNVSAPVVPVNVGLYTLQHSFSVTLHDRRIPVQERPNKFKYLNNNSYYSNMAARGRKTARPGSRQM
jgi:hypothetical protein